MPGRDGRWGRDFGDGSNGRYLDACKNHWFERSDWYVRPAWRTGIGHPTPMPAVVAARATRLWSNEGDLVVDPRCGSGVALVEAVRAGRRAIGCDVSAESVRISRLRLAQERMPLEEAAGG